MLQAGGHTAEMLMMLEALDKAKYSPRVYVVAATDSMSQKKAESKEQTWAGSSSADVKTSVSVRMRFECGEYVRNIQAIDVMTCG